MSREGGNLGQNYKLVVVGGGGVGKSALTIQFIQWIPPSAITNKNVEYPGHDGIVIAVEDVGGPGMWGMRGIKSAYQGYQSPMDES